MCVTAYNELLKSLGLVVKDMISLNQKCKFYAIFRYQRPQNGLMNQLYVLELEVVSSKGVTVAGSSQVLKATENF